jgi:hypothetical protein
VPQDSWAELEAIKQLKARYFRLLDEKRWEEWGAVFSEDAELDTTQDAPDARARGRDAIVAMVSQAVGQAVTVHHGHMPEIELTSPTTATGIWAMEDTLEFPGDPPALVVHGRGHYFETYEKDSGGQWCITSLKLRRLWLAYDGRRVRPPPG